MDNDFSSGYAVGVSEGNRNNGGDGMFGGSWLWIIVVFALLFGWGNGGFGGNRGGGQGSAVDGYVLTSDFANIERKIDGVNNGLCDGLYAQAQLVNGVQMSMANGFAQAELARSNQQAAIMQQMYAMSTANQQCCCETQRLLDRNDYNAAMNTAAINANTTAGIQKVLDKMCENETNALRARVQQLELQSAMCGVVRYPTMTTYATNCNPFFSGCGCNGNI